MNHSSPQLQHYIQYAHCSIIAQQHTGPTHNVGVFVEEAREDGNQSNS